MAGCKGAKAILAVNTDPEAPILASADYAVIGDLHEVVPRSPPSSEGRRGLSRRRASPPRSRSSRGRGRGCAVRAARALPDPARPRGKPRRAFDLPRASQRGDDRPRPEEALQRLGPGSMHAFIFWGFLVLFPTIFMAVARSSTATPAAADSPLGWLERQGWYAFLVDLFAVLVLVGVVGAFWIRKVQRPQRSRAATSARPTSSSRSSPGIVTTLLLGTRRSSRSG
jgi:hypothetical protein